MAGFEQFESEGRRWIQPQFSDDPEQATEGQQTAESPEKHIPPALQEQLSSSQARAVVRVWHNGSGEFLKRQERSSIWTNRTAGTRPGMVQPESILPNARIAHTRAMHVFPGDFKGAAESLQVLCGRTEQNGPTIHSGVSGRSVNPK